MKTYAVALFFILNASKARAMAFIERVYEKQQIVVILGKENKSFYGSEKDGDSLVISGTQNGRCIFFGTYRDWTGINEWYLAPKVKLSVQWSPEEYRTCNRRDWQGRCVGHTLHTLPHGFWIETVADFGARKILEPVEVKNPTNLDNVWIELPQTGGIGDIKALEFRACSPYGGGSFTLTIHKIEYGFSYNYLRK